MKAYLLFRGRTFPLTHNLTELSRPLADLDTSLLAIVLPHLDLSDFSTLYRYPGEPVLPTVAQARPWVEAVRGMYAAGGAGKGSTIGTMTEYCHRPALFGV